jgi:outer membrane protein OmpU
MILLNADTSQNKFDLDNNVARQTLIYIENAKMGKFEAGSYQGVYPAMKVSGSTIAHAAGGIDGDWSYWINTFGNGKHVNTPTLPIAFEPDKGVNSAKINYYSPQYAGFNFRITFIPDVDQHGTVAVTKTVAKNFASDAGNAFNGAMGYKNIFQGGISYEGKMHDLGLKLSATAESGDAKDDVLSSVQFSRHDLRAFELGANVSYKKFTLGGSYGDWGKSGAYKKNASGTSVGGNKKAHFWNAGLAYECDKFGASIGYFSSKSGAFSFAGGATPAYSNLQTRTETVSFGMDYKLAPGFMPYAEITGFSMKDRSADTKNSGSVTLVGTKLTF